MTTIKPNASAGIQATTTQINQKNKPDVSSSSLDTASKTTLSAKAKELQKIKKVYQETPDIREDKVKELAAKINSGTYKLDSDKITQGIVKEAIKDEISKTPEMILKKDPVKGEA